MIAWYVLSATESFMVAVLAAPVAVGVLSMAIERFLATFGGGIQRIPSPTPGAVRIPGMQYPVYRLVVAGVSLAAIAALWLFLTHTRYGL